MTNHEITYLLTKKSDKTIAQFLNESQKSYLTQTGVWVLWANQTELLAWNAKPDKTYYTGAYAQRKLSSLVAPQSQVLKANLHLLLHGR
ncbi:hypothetical protein VQ643_04495 [Pseudomonas sp. F1_0610]|uniref:hypothetical protein n=1 Tax=Pseudomonas sp. F1_0610 TaxID=3114284 RepID=UPI0039C37E0F